MIDPTELFQIGLALLKQGAHQQAAELAASAALEHPERSEFHELLGVARHHRGEHDWACEALETASLLKPLDVGARFCLAGSYAATGARDLAVFVLRMIAEDEGAPLWLLPKVASRLGEMNELDSALLVCRTILRRDPIRHEAHFGEGYYLRRLGASAAAAVDSIRRAHELAPEVTLYRVVLASLWQELDRAEDACELIRGIAPAAVQCPTMLRRMMEVYYSARAYDELAACSRRAAQLSRTTCDCEGETE